MECPGVDMGVGKTVDVGVHRLMPPRGALFPTRHRNCPRRCRTCCRIRGGEGATRAHRTRSYRAVADRPEQESVLREEGDLPPVVFAHMSPEPHSGVHLL
jgi:hypothetical protein